MKIEGIISAMVTPFEAGGQRVEEVGLRSLVNRTIRAGADGLVPCGGTGEFSALSDDERRFVTSVVCDEAAGRVPVIPHTGAASTKEAIALSQHAEEVGATAVLLTVPYFEPISFVEAREYYAAVAGSVGIPIVVYNHPGSTGLHMTTSFLVELANEIETVKYVKDSSGDLGQLFELASEHAEEITVLSGVDSLLGPALLLGVRGAIMGGVNFLASPYSRMMAAARDGDLAAVASLWRGLYPVTHFLDTNPYNPAVKAGCEVIGESSGVCRSPAQPLTRERFEQLKKLMTASGVVEVEAGDSLEGTKIGRGDGRHSA